MWSASHPRWILFEGEVLISAEEIREEERRRKMSVQVKGLADTVRQAKAAIDKASTVATRVNTSASQLVVTMAAVEDMTAQLDGANADLQAALGTVTNGAPPLEVGATAPTTSSSDATTTATASATPAVEPVTGTPGTQRRSGQASGRGG
jgi:multidrug resistance efflux pump